MSCIPRIWSVLFSQQAGQTILILSRLGSGTQWKRSPKGGVTLIDADVFTVNGETSSDDFGTFQERP